MKGFLIAADKSGSGKTTLTTGILHSLSRGGMSVAPFKCGPDYIDTLHLAKASGSDAYNLDPVMLSEETMLEIFARGTHEKDIAVVEGVMGLFDGIKPEGFYGSSYHVAKAIGLPIVMVINAASSSYSIAAVLRGFQELSEMPVAGVILNNVASANHERLLTEAVNMHTDIPVIGCVPRQDELLGSRHLGIKTALETDDSYLLKCKVIAESHVDMDFLKSLSTEKSFSCTPKEIIKDKICLTAFDKAFNFYYQSNFDTLRDLGYEIKQFSPLADEPVSDADLVYLGGGYPELYAKELSECRTFIETLRHYCASGKPMIAECGGMMALTKGIHCEDGYYGMAGVFDAECRMMGKRQALGYVRAYNEANPKGYTGHEFHYSALENVNEPYFFNIEKLTTGQVKQDGFMKGRTLAGYTHFHFMSEPNILNLILG